MTEHEGWAAMARALGNIEGTLAAMRLELTDLAVEVKGTAAARDAASREILALATRIAAVEAEIADLRPAARFLSRTRDRALAVIAVAGILWGLWRPGAADVAEAAARLIDGAK